LSEPSRPNYIIYAPGFDPDSGGAIFLHQLVHALVSLGEDAALWPWGVPPKRSFGGWLKQVLRKPRLLWQGNAALLRRNPALTTPVARARDLREDTIVVYPEVTLGNPLEARHIARWLLYTPGQKDPYAFTEGEMFFRAGEMSDLPDVTGGAQDLYLWQRHPAYRNEKRPDRKGACYILRKGREKDRIPQTADAICIDGMSHEETAQVFNACETFYSYDEATFYSQYAAICGCTSVIVPGYFRTREDWVASHPIGRVGVAYGLDDLDHARTTREQVAEVLAAQEQAGLETVRSFISRTQTR